MVQEAEDTTCLLRLVGAYSYNDENENLTIVQIKELKKMKQRDAATLLKIQQVVTDSIFPRIMGA